MTIELGHQRDTGGKAMVLHSTASGQFLTCDRDEVTAFLVGVKDAKFDGLFEDPPLHTSASVIAPCPASPTTTFLGLFTENELAGLHTAYQALLRVGNASAQDGRWQNIIDRGHQDLGVLLSMLAAKEIDLKYQAERAGA